MSTPLTRHSAHMLPLAAVLLAVLLGGCTPDPAPPPPAPVAPPPTAPAQGPARIEGDKVIATEGNKQIIFRVGAEVTSSYAVYEVVKNPSGYPFTAWLTALDSPLYRDFASKITNFDPMAPGTQGFNVAQGRLQRFGIIAIDPEIVGKIKELLAKGRFSPKPQIMRLSGNALALDQYTEGGLRMILPGGIPEERGILVTKIELYAK